MDAIKTIKIIVLGLLCITAVIFFIETSKDPWQKDAYRIAKLYCSIHKQSAEPMLSSKEIGQKYIEAELLEKKLERKYARINQRNRFLAALNAELKKCK